MSNQTNYKSLGNRKVLVVDDIEMNQQLAKHIMQSWGFTVDVAANGKEAVAKVEKNFYDEKEKRNYWCFVFDHYLYV